MISRISEGVPVKEVPVSIGSLLQELSAKRGSEL